MTDRSMRAGRRPTKYTALKNMEKEPGEFWLLSLPSVTRKTVEHNLFNQFLSQQRTKRQFQTVNEKPFTKSTLHWPRWQNSKSWRAPLETKSNTIVWRKLSGTTCRQVSRFSRDGHSLPDNLFQCLIILKVKVFTHV